MAETTSELVGRLAAEHGSIWSPHASEEIAKEAVKTLSSHSAEEQMSFVMTALEAMDGSPFSLGGALAAVVSLMLRRKLPWTTEQVVRMVQLVSRPRSSFPYRGVLRAAGTVRCTRELADALRKLRPCITDYLGGTEMRELHERIDGLVSDAPPAACAWTPDGPWSAAVKSEIEGQPQWAAAFEHVRELKSGEPSGKWRAKAETLVTAIGRDQVKAAALRWLALGPCPEKPLRQASIKESNDQRGFVWLLAGFADQEVARALAEFAFGCFHKIPNIGAVSAKAGNACLNVLSAIGTPEAVAQLARLKQRIKYDTAQRLIGEALDEAAKRAGISMEELEERTVPPLALVDSAGKRNKDAEKLLAAHQSRIERLLLSQRQIPYEIWRECYLEHPLIGEIARRLIWQFDSGLLGIWRDGGIADCFSGPVQGSAVRLWHPIHSDVQTVINWRCFLEDNRIRQPFKQAHRELYLLTPAERETATFSQRFSGHIVRQHQFQALCEQRGWRFRLMGPFDGANTPSFELPQFGLTAEIEVHDPRNETPSGHGIYLYLETGRAFFRSSGSSAAQALEAIPPVVFSEVMRDIDLFVGVASVANDPRFSREPDRLPFGQYIVETWSHDLTESGRSRREFLQRLVPKLAIAERCRFEDRYLVVRGDLKTYRIHLNSSNVLMEPGSRYLCIVHGPRSKATAPETAFLPFDGDEVLSLILSKAFLLANDRKITDPDIRDQISA